MGDPFPDPFTDSQLAGHPGRVLWPLHISISRTDPFTDPFTFMNASLDAARGDGILPTDPTALHDASARRLQGGVDVFGACLGFVQRFCL